MSLEYINSQRGQDLLVYKRFIYKKDRTICEKVIWRCNENKNCKGRMHTMQGKLFVIYYRF